MGLQLMAVADGQTEEFSMSTEFTTQQKKTPEYIRN